MGMRSEVCILFMLLVMFVGAVCRGAHRARGMREGVWRRGSRSGIPETDRGNGRGLGEVRHLFGVTSGKRKEPGKLYREAFFGLCFKEGTSDQW